MRENRTDRMLISVVIPVYNSTVLDEIARRVNAVFAACPDRYELIFVVDASTNHRNYLCAH